LIIRHLQKNKNLFSNHSNPFAKKVIIAINTKNFIAMKTTSITQKPSFQIVGKINIIYSEVILLKADINYTQIYLKNGAVYLVATPLKKMEIQFLNFSFFRVHKSYLINLKYVRKPRKELKNIVKMANNHLVCVSRRKKEEFAKAVGWL
jgi:DNA-binding LytR/AlgR family response regulator